MKLNKRSLLALFAALLLLFAAGCSAGAQNNAHRRLCPQRAQRRLPGDRRNGHGQRRCV